MSEKIKELITASREADKAHRVEMRKQQMNEAEEQRLWEVRVEIKKQLCEAVSEACGVNVWELAALCQR